MTIVLVSFGVALGAISLYLGILVGSVLTRKSHEEEIRRLRSMVVAIREELSAWERGERPKK